MDTMTVSARTPSLIWFRTMGTMCGCHTATSMLSDGALKIHTPAAGCSGAHFHRQHYDVRKLDDLKVVRRHAHTVGFVLFTESSGGVCHHEVLRRDGALGDEASSHR